MSAPTPRQKAIEKQLGVTHAGLTVLARRKAGRTQGATLGNASVRLVEQGYLISTGNNVGDFAMTAGGLAILAAARRMGW